MSETSSTTKDALRGMTGWAVLACLERGPGHGYGLLRRLQTSGWPNLKSGTLYPVLHRLEQTGLLSSRWEHDDASAGKRVFAITPAGVTSLRETEEALATAMNLIRENSP